MKQTNTSFTFKTDFTVDEAIEHLFSDSDLKAMSIEVVTKNHKSGLLTNETARLFLKQVRINNCYRPK